MRTAVHLWKSSFVLFLFFNFFSNLLQYCICCFYLKISPHGICFIEYFSIDINSINQNTWYITDLYIFLENCRISWHHVIIVIQHIERCTLQGSQLWMNLAFPLSGHFLSLKTVPFWWKLSVPLRFYKGQKILLFSIFLSGHFYEKHFVTKCSLSMCCTYWLRRNIIGRGSSGFSL